MISFLALPLRVVCVGGDGMFSEIIHGLVWRTQADGGVDPNCPEEALSPCSLRIGIIPAGQARKQRSWMVSFWQWKRFQWLTVLFPPLLFVSESESRHVTALRCAFFTVFPICLFCSRFHRLHLLRHRGHQRPRDLGPARHSGWVTTHRQMSKYKNTHLS